MFTITLIIIEKQNIINIIEEELGDLVFTIAIILC